MVGSDVFPMEIVPFFRGHVSFRGVYEDMDNLWDVHHWRPQGPHRCLYDGAMSRLVTKKEGSAKCFFRKPKDLVFFSDC